MNSKLDFLRPKLNAKLKALKNSGQIGGRMETRLVEPFCKMVLDADISVNQAVNRCIEKCLIDTGYLEPAKSEGEE